MGKIGSGRVASPPGNSGSAPSPSVSASGECPSRSVARGLNLHVFSDLHFDARALSWEPKLAPGADVVVCAGDVCEGLPEAFAFLRASFPRPTPIITVAGNHSFYSRVIQREMVRGRAAAVEHGITFIDNQAIVLGSVRFVGGALWTDYALYGWPGVSAEKASRQMNDHSLIFVDRGGALPERFTPGDALARHREHVIVLDSYLAEPFDGPTVVVTHHAPHPNSIAPAFYGDALNPAFASDLTWLIEKHQPDLWIHGHTHASADYRVGRTRVLCNPHGYGRENVSGFDPELVVRLPASGIAAPEGSEPKGLTEGKSPALVEGDAHPLLQDHHDRSGTGSERKEGRRDG